MDFCLQKGSSTNLRTSLKHLVSANKPQNIKFSTPDLLSRFLIYTNIIGTGLEVDLCFQYSHLITLSHIVYKTIYLKTMKNAAFAVSCDHALRGC